MKSFLFLIAIFLALSNLSEVQGCNFRFDWPDWKPGQVRILTSGLVSSSSCIELSHIGYNQTFGFYSTYGGLGLLSMGWMPHPGKVISPVPALDFAQEYTSSRLTAAQTYQLSRALKEARANSSTVGNYCLFNWGSGRTSHQWAVDLVNSVLKN